MSTEDPFAPRIAENQKIPRKSPTLQVLREEERALERRVAISGAETENDCTTAGGEWSTPGSTDGICMEKTKSGTTEAEAGDAASRAARVRSRAASQRSRAASPRSLARRDASRLRSLADADAK